MRSLIGGGACCLLLYAVGLVILHLPGWHALLFGVLVETAMFLFQIAVEP